MWSLRNINPFLLIVLIGYLALVCAQSTTPEITTTAKTTKADSTIMTTTEKPTTTTTTEKSTTTTTTTTAPTTSSTTMKPTPKPTPVPKPTIGKWNSSCIMVQMAAQLNFSYETTDNSTATILYNLPSDADVSDGTCDEKTQQLVLQWELNTLYLQFDKNETKNTFALYTMHFKIQAEGNQFPNAKGNQTIELLHNGNIFDTPLKMSYHCTREQDLNMTKTILDKKLAGTVALTNVQFEAFQPANTTQFSTAKDCDAMDTPDVVPIAVGIALAALILIVLIAYLIARRRSTARGYTSF